MPTSPPTTADRDRILGIDPGTHRCGWGLIDREGARLRHVDNGVVSLPGHPSLPERLAHIFDQIEAICRQYQPTVAAVEGIFQHKNARSALILGHARGVALLITARQGIAVHEYTPQQVKKAVSGSGRAEKDQIQQMITLRLGLTDLPQADAADAVAVALCHAQHLAFPVPANVPVARGGRARAAAGLKAFVEAQAAGRTS